MSKSIKSTILAFSASAVLVTAAPALALPVGHSAAAVVAEGTTVHHGRGYDRDDRGYGRGYGNRQAYNDRGYYEQANVQSWRGDDGRMYCRRANGTTGLLVGGVVGGLLGHEIAGRRGDRTLGVILGAAGGALVGRAIDKGGSSCR